MKQSKQHYTVPDLNKFKSFITDFVNRKVSSPDLMLLEVDAEIRERFVKGKLSMTKEEKDIARSIKQRRTVSPPDEIKRKLSVPVCPDCGSGRWYLRHSKVENLWLEECLQCGLSKLVNK